MKYLILFLLLPFVSFSQSFEKALTPVEFQQFQIVKDSLEKDIKQQGLDFSRSPLPTLKYKGLRHYVYSASCGESDITFYVILPYSQGFRVVEFKENFNASALIDN